MKHFSMIVACAAFALFFAACEGNTTTTKDADTPVVADDNLLTDEDGITPTEEEPDEVDVDQKTDPDVPKDDGPVVTDDGPVVTDDGPVVTDDGPVVTDDGPVVTDDGTVVTDDGTVEPDDAIVVTDDVVTDDIVADGDELLNDDDVIVYVNPCAPTNPCVDLNRSVCTDVNLDGVAECSCDDGYTLDGGDTCINQKDVSCDTDNANPANSTDIVEDVTVNYTDGGGWEDPALCAWECDTDYVLDDFGACVLAAGPCADSPCTDANKHVCADDGDGNPVCSCDEHYNDDDMNGTCEPDTQYVACTNELEANSHWMPSAPYSGEGHVTQTWDGTKFAPTADFCPQGCNTDYTLEGGVCIHEKEVDCGTNPAKPAHSVDIIEQVTITFSTVDGDWSDPALCDWECDAAYHWNDDVEECLETLTVDWCNLEAPADSEVAQGEYLTVYGRVYIAGVTDLSADVDAFPQIIGQLSGNPSLGVDAATWPWDGWMDLDPNPDNDSAVGIGDTDEYLVTVPVMSDPGEMDITVRFSGDSGATWTYCNANRLPAYNGTDAENPYDPLKHGRLTVTEGYVDPCALENPCTKENQTVCTDIDLNGVAECACDENYSDDGDGNCVADTRNDQPCTGKLANSVYNTAITITQTWDGDSWEPSTVATYNEEASATECRFKCEDYYYVWDGDSCEDRDECTVSFNFCTINEDSMALCINNSPGNDCGCSEGFELAVLGEVGSHHRTCEDIDECTTLSNPCDTYDVGATCGNTIGGYTCYCSLNYTSDGVTCLPDGPRTENCVDNKPTNSHWVADGNYNGDGTVLQTWTLADGWQPPADECPWACDVDHHVRWDPMFGQFCDPDTQLVACTNTLPDNAVWRTEGVYGGGKLTQTWDGDSYEPATDTCPLDCEATYHYENSSAQCVTNTIVHLCSNELPANAAWVLTPPYNGDGSVTRTWVGPGDDDWTPDTDTCPWECTDPLYHENLDLNECLLTLTVDWCSIHSPDTHTGAPGSSVAIYGWLTVSGVTDLTTGPDTASFPQIKAELGAGPRDSDPATWGDMWIDAAPNAGFSDPNDDEFMASPVLDMPSGSYDYAYRFSGDSGNTWTYCDTNGSTDGYQIENAGKLSVMCAENNDCTGGSDGPICAPWSFCVECMQNSECGEGFICDTVNNNCVECVDNTDCTDPTEPICSASLKTCGPNAVYFSEYIEGTSNNKAIEIYNGTPDTIDLTKYRVLRYNNGAAEATDTLLLSSCGTSTTLAAGGMILPVNPSADASLTSIASCLHTITFYNGDDALVIEYSEDGSTAWTAIDQFGVVGQDPGTNWPVAGGIGATSEFTLVRKATVVKGTTDWSLSAGTTADNSEWIVYPQNTFSYFGAR